jgi:beta-fructofuranosidase
MPFDPNGAIHWNGRAHLFYIYQDRGVHKFGHVSSVDLLHWRHHPTALGPTPDSPEKGIFSGNCFINKQGAATMLYHGVDAGNCIATSTDPQLEAWTKLAGNPIIPNPPQGAAFASWDPHGWLEGDTYYAIFGGTRAALFKAKELNQWKYVGDFLHHTVEGVDLREDISCPDFFPMGGKHVLVCISHRLGTRYYVGDWKNEQFYPEYHERMSWVDNAYFAPETMRLPDGRRLLWAWMFDGRSRLTQRASGWSGEMALVRELELGPDNRLRQRPLRELERLRQNERAFGERVIQADADWVLEGLSGDALEVELSVDPGDASEVGLVLARSPGGEEETRVSYHAADHQLRIDARKSSLREGPRNVESAPFSLQPGETLRLRVFLDRSVVEAFAADRQAAMRRIYPSRRDSKGAAVFARGGTARVIGLKIWDMAPTNPH